MQWAATLAAHCLLYYVTDACNFVAKVTLKKYSIVKKNYGNQGNTILNCHNSINYFINTFLFSTTI